MKKNIAFVANGQKLQFFDLIGQNIQEKNNEIHIYWICVAKHQYDYLLSRGYKVEDILLINWDILKGNGKSIGEYKLNELASVDRKLKYHFNDGIKYLTLIQSLFYSFVEDKSLHYIFGETTWAHEILMSRICLDKFASKCHYLHPQSIRIPNGRFAFMDSEFQNNIFSPSEFLQSEKDLNKFDIPLIPIVPQRVADVAKDVKSSLSWKYRIKRIVDFFIFNRLKDNGYDSLQGLKDSLWIRIKKFWQIELNKLYYTKIFRKKPITYLENKKFFLITLHMQPEASIDVVGRYYEDQYQLIKNVWRILPNDYYLVVKEHTNAIGNRGRSFFKKCVSLKNVIIVNELESSHILLNKAESVFTNSGTIALEGALFNKDVFVFSNIFFDKLSKCHKITLEDLKFTKNYFQLIESCKEKDKNKLSLDEYSKYIIRSSFDGIIDPHKNSIYFTDNENIEKIANSFLMLLLSNTLEYK